MIVLSCFLAGGVFAQESRPVEGRQTLTVPVPPPEDTLGHVAHREGQEDGEGKTGAASVEDKEQRLGIKIAKDALPAQVTTTARDSAVLDIKKNVFYLYGDAHAQYEDLGVRSGQLVFFQKEHLLAATPAFDTAGNKISVQEFKQGEELIAYDSLKYNFQSKRAIVRNARSQYGEGFMHSQQVKRNPDGSISGLGNLYTTCNLEHPHFGIRAKKVKVIPNRIIATGPANIELMDVPTPFFLPFGIFPEQKNQRSGFILPTYTMEENKGLGLLKGGYYFALSDYLGIVSQFDIYTKGSWGMFATAQYANRYRYNGSLSFNYGYSKLGESYESKGRIFKDFQVQWNHSVDGRARPGSNFSALVVFGTSTYNQLNGVSVQNILNNQYSSNITYSKAWRNKPYSLTLSARHNQSTQTGLVTVYLPELSFNLGQFSPFQRKVMSGSPRWYEKITISYSMNATNKVSFYDTAISFNALSIRNFDNGLKHSINAQTNYTLFRYFNWNINVPLTEYWNTRQVFLQYNPDLGRLDTTAIKDGFFATRDFNVSSSVSTRVYGMKTFKKGKVAGVRHVMTPNVGFTYTPGFAFSPFRYLYETYLTENGLPTYRSPYEFSPIGGPSNAKGSGQITFGIQNTLQMKVRTTDTTGEAGTKTLSLIDGFSIRSSYDMFKDSNNLSNIVMNFSTSLFKGLNLTGGAFFDPYVYEDARLTKRYLLSEGRGLADFKSGSIGLGFSLQGTAQTNKARENAEKGSDDVKRLLSNDGIEDYYDFSVPWNLSVSSSLAIVRNRGREGRADSIVFRPNLSFNGGFNLTERWKVNVTSGVVFDGFKKLSMGLTSIDINRDLHCWQMNLNLVPFGMFRSFNFTLQVKAAVLQDLKLTRRKAYQDNF